jgi:hypothetical protein
VPAAAARSSAAERAESRAVSSSAARASADTSSPAGETSTYTGSLAAGWLAVSRACRTSVTTSPGSVARWEKSRSNDPSSRRRSDAPGEASAVLSGVVPVAAGYTAKSTGGLGPTCARRTNDVTPKSSSASYANGSTPRGPSRRGRPAGSSPPASTTRAAGGRSGTTFTSAVGGPDPTCSRVLTRIRSYRPSRATVSRPVRTRPVASFGGRAIGCRSSPAYPSRAVCSGSVAVTVTSATVPAGASIRPSALVTVSGGRFACGG